MSALSAAQHLFLNSSGPAPAGAASPSSPGLPIDQKPEDVLPSIPADDSPLGGLLMPEAGVDSASDFGGCSRPTPLEERIRRSPFWLAISDQPFALACTLCYAYNGPGCEFSPDYERLSAELLAQGGDRLEVLRCLKDMMLEALLGQLESSHSPLMLPPDVRSNFERHRAALAAREMPYLEFRRKMQTEVSGLALQLVRTAPRNHYADNRRELARWGMGSIQARMPPQLFDADAWKIDVQGARLARACGTKCRALSGGPPQEFGEGVAQFVRSELAKLQPSSAYRSAANVDVATETLELRKRAFVIQHVALAVIDATGATPEHVEAARRSVALAMDEWPKESESGNR
ncbi:hypothetical protein [Xylophilus sp. GOD-11R]|uniref:hypothetical protein n=1 Tax=Xylophilus sp. GOD-11R TaxID=3089814 RepID=UPI00298CA0EF|nr:hypothetical protein [Xylophilus sp. GOD-11R]WPB55277.1 hypothetical protein R9X41_14085 [Xylophilus sp. GOD-11R]